MEWVSLKEPGQVSLFGETKCPALKAIKVAYGINTKCSSQNAGNMQKAANTKRENMEYARNLLLLHVAGIRGLYVLPYFSPHILVPDFVPWLNYSNILLWKLCANYIPTRALNCTKLLAVHAFFAFGKMQFFTSYTKLFNVMKFFHFFLSLIWAYTGCFLTTRQFLCHSLELRIDWKTELRTDTHGEMFVGSFTNLAYTIMVFLLANSHD